MHVVLALIALLITYGSLYPFGFEPDATGWDGVRAFVADFDMRTHLGNVIANVVLFVPYAFVAVMAVEGARHRRSLLCVYMGAGVLLAVLLQVAQLWIPGRNPAMSDAVINAAGMLIGWGLAWIVASAVGGPRGLRAPVDWLLPLLLALLWVAYRWFPLVPTLDLQNVRNALKPLVMAFELDPLRVAANTMLWACWLWLLLRTPLRRMSWMWPAGAGVLVVALQPLFISGTLGSANILGLGIALILLPWLRDQRAAVPLFVGLLLLLLVLGLEPFRLADSPKGFAWIPFKGFLGGSMETNVLNLIYKSFVYGATVYLAREVGFDWRGAGILVAFWLGGIEVAQVWIPTRTAEITDPLMALLIAFAMARYEHEVVVARRNRTRIRADR